MTVQPATIKLFLPLGDPTRLRTAELSNWSGKAVAAPRSDLAEFYDRSEAEQSGVYVLAGADSKTGEPAAYIGEAGRIKDRIRRHVQDGHDFWNRLIAFVSKDENLTKAHVLYLEGAMIEAAQEADRVLLVNAQASGSRLPESDRADMDVYLSRVRQLLPVLGSDLLTPKPSKPTAPPSTVFTTSIRKLSASGSPSSGGFVVYSGSQAVRTARPSALPYILDERRRLLERNVLVEEDGHFVFAEDTEFSSPSMAAAVVKGGSENGLRAWIDSDGRSLKQIEEGESTDTPPHDPTP